MAKSNTKFVAIRIRGLSPVLQNAFPIDDPNKSTRSTMKGTTPEPAEVAGGRLYRDDNNNVCFPAGNIQAGIISAGRFHKMGRKQVTTGTTTIITGGIFMCTLNCTLYNPETGNPIRAGKLGIESDGEVTEDCRDWVVDSRRVVVPSTKGSVISHRPKVDKWETDFVLQVETDQFDTAFVRVLINDLCTKIGIGDFRPEKRGIFGRCSVTLFKEFDSLEEATKEVRSV